jgi:proton glutamate symport protein
MKKVLQWYFSVSLIVRIIVCLIVGALIGAGLWILSGQTDTDHIAHTLNFIEPFGTVFVYMLKMIVIPVVFFSLLCGASSLPVSKFGRVGLKTIAWYLLCSLFAAIVGACLALVINPGSGTDIEKWKQMVPEATAGDIAASAETEGTLVRMLYNMFTNPFEALATGNFLPIIVFSIMFGLAIRVTIEAAPNSRQSQRLENLIELVKACRDAMFKLVEWILEYSPIGVLALTITNFARFGPSIVGPYVSVTLGVVCGILVMVFCVYPILLLIVTKQNPFIILKKIRKAMIMAFVTRSSAATLPVSIKTAEDELKIQNELASFSLPLGATINMDGVCVHLPMFAVLAANMFDIKLTISGLAILVITTVLASIGAGGVPGGSLMLLFIILETMELNPDQVAIVVALALGINPVLDMFETMNNVTGDLVCTYTVAHNENLLKTANVSNE